MSKIFLVRHAQSEGNANRDFLYKQTNVSVPLTPLGVEQAKQAGLFFSEELKGNNSVKVWNSPYMRTRQTSQYIKDALLNSNIDFEEEESIYISERQFGLLDDNQHMEKTHAKELAHYKLHQNQKHDFWARPPLGESPFDMCMRLDFFIRMILAADNHENHIIVSHGAAVRGFITMKQKLKFEGYSEMKNPPNASVQLIENTDFKGIVFTPLIISN